MTASHCGVERKAELGFKPGASSAQPEASSAGPHPWLPESSPASWALPCPLACGPCRHCFILSTALGTGREKGQRQHGAGFGVGLGEPSPASSTDCVT